MSRVRTAARAILSDIDLFSRFVLGLPLHSYQSEPLRAVIDSVLKRQGHDFLLIFPRQSGKNEAAAQLLVYLLNLFQRLGGNLVYGATGDGLGRGMKRLEDRLENPWNAGRWRKARRPTRRILGKAAVVFISTHPNTAARGETAHWLLVIDELQEHDPAHIEAVFQPMRAANNATALYLGTVKSTGDALWIKKGELEAEQRGDGRQRIWIVSPERVIEDNPSYGHFLAARIRKLGHDHPIIRSEYYNEPVEGTGGLFDARRLALMKGDHTRRRSPDAARGALGQPASSPRRLSTIAGSPPVYVATLDVAGQDEAATDAMSRLAQPGRDYTVAHIFEVVPGRPDEPGPIYLALDVFVDHGSRHFQDIPGQPKLAERLLAWLRHWGASHLVADQSGVGQGLVDWLSAKLGPNRVSGYVFTRRSKAGLGSVFLSLIETGRFQYWRSEKPYGDAWWFFQQAQNCGYTVPAGGRFETDLQWGVPPSVAVDTPLGRRTLHDDRLISAALVAVADDLFRSGKISAGRAVSAIVHAPDPSNPDALDF